MDMEKFFDINSYSEKNMPLICELYEKVSENYFWEKSDDYKKCGDTKMCSMTLKPNCLKNVC